MYKIVRMFDNGPDYTVKTNLTLQEAQDWVASPEADSTTCNRNTSIRRTVILGPWHDEYQAQ